LIEQKTEEMKDVSQEEMKKAYDAAVEGAIKGGAIGFVSSALTSGVLQKTNAIYRTSLTIPIKVGLVSAATVAGVFIGGDKAIINFDKKTHSIVKEDHEIQQQQQTIATNRWPVYLKEHRYHIVAGVWVVSMIGSLAISFSQPNLKFSQKLVHARMYAQFSTLCALLATAAFNSLPDTPVVVLPSEPTLQRPPTRTFTVHQDQTSQSSS